MTDIREAIMLQIMSICGTLPIASGATYTVYRNRPTIAEDARPAIVVLDGDEQADERDLNKRASAPRRITMTPSIYLLANDDAEDIGATLNEMRAEALHALLSDATLKGMTVNDEGLEYLGSRVTAENGRKMSGVMEVQFAVTYLLRLTDLTPA